MALYNKVIQTSGIMDGKYMALHWRRGDFIAQHCFGEYLQKSTNCLDAKALVSYLRKFLSSFQPNRIYISTNEDRREELAELERMGFIGTFSIELSSMERTAPDLLIAELQIMIKAKIFICGDASTGIKFIDRKHNLPWSTIDSFVQQTRARIIEKTAEESFTF